MGARVYWVLEQHSNIAEDECVVEIGSERGEGSTFWLSTFCAERDVTFHTVDIDPHIHKNAVSIVSEHPKSHAHLSSGEDFLAGLDQCISFAYLDGFDCIPKGFETAKFVRDCANRYQQIGLHLSNDECEASHLRQAELFVAKAATRCTLLIDDTFLAESWSGKGALAMPYLRTQGFVLSDLGGAGLALR
jgi:hypothetical protein